MHKKSVLAIDDSLKFLYFVRKVVGAAGHEVHIASNALEFMALYAKVVPDTVILEVVMPEVDGIEIIQWLCEQPGRCHVIVVTTDYLYLAKAAQTLARPYPHISVETALKQLPAEELLTLIGKGPSSEASDSAGGTAEKG